MIPELRQAFNARFNSETYQAFLDWIADQYHHRPPFRIAETPVFIPQYLKEQLEEACEELVDVIVRPDFKQLSESALVPGQIAPDETAHTTFLVLDFGVCQDENGRLYPQLIEAQGFPSLFFYQDFLAKAYRRFFDIPKEVHHHFGGLDSAAYHELLRKVIIGDSDPENVILLEVQPEKQTTAIDFFVGKYDYGIEPVCISRVRKSGRSLYYERDGRRIDIHKIYNRVIFDELLKRTDLAREFDLTDEFDGQWVGHPNWFFRISKHTLPLFKSKYVPESHYLHQLHAIPDDLENYVLKPLYSFAGSGVIINVKPEDITAVEHPEHYILQRKVTYAPVIPTPDVPAKCEIRILLIWEDNAPRPILVNNLVRLSKGEMVGVRYNKDKEWVGGTIGFF
ncbi:MAG TPA: hypothetical protein PKE06_10465 [Flavilitoribacter sp.]|nr:hypothetical protein [Flavilitoribacter sp.]